MFRGAEGPAVPQPKFYHWIGGPHCSLPMDPRGPRVLLAFADDAYGGSGGSDDHSDIPFAG